MSVLHESQISKSRRITGYVLTILASAMIVFAGVGKILRTEEMIENLSKIPNFRDLIIFIGVLELVILTIYWIPKTSNIGFFLITSLCGGIIAGEIVLGEAPIPGIIVTILFYVGTMLRKPSLSGLGI